MIAPTSASVASQVAYTVPFSGSLITALVRALKSVTDTISHSTLYVLCNATGFKILAVSSVVAQFGALAHFTSSAVVSSRTVSTAPPCALVCL
jgi:hypothetical protein